MNLTIEPTTQVVALNSGLQARIWEGTTEDGTPVVLFITRVGVPNDAPPELHAKFADELTEQRAPTAVWPARLVL